MKKVVSTILGILFVIIVICAVFVGTYVFSKPSHISGTDSRQLILGYFKINEKAGKINLMIMPNKDRDKSLDLGEKLGMFATITYRNLKYDEPYAEKGWTFLNEIQREEIMNAEAKCKFILSNSDESVFNCDRTRTVTEFNGDEKADTRVNDAAG